MIKITGTDLGKYICVFLQDTGINLFSEIILMDYFGNNVIGIVASIGSIKWGIIVRPNCSFELIRSAEHASHYCNIVSIFVPYINSFETQDFYKAIAQKLGFGVLMLSEISDNSGEYAARELVKPIIRRKVASLHLETRRKIKNQTIRKNLQAWIPLKHICSSLVAYIRCNEGSTLNDAIRNIIHNHNFSGTIEILIGIMINQGIIPELKFRKNRIYIKTAQPNSEKMGYAHPKMFEEAISISEGSKTEVSDLLETNCEELKKNTNSSIDTTNEFKSNIIENQEIINDMFMSDICNIKSQIEKALLNGLKVLVVCANGKYKGKILEKINDNINLRPTNFNPKLKIYNNLIKISSIIKIEILNENE